MLQLEPSEVDLWQSSLIAQAKPEPVTIAKPESIQHQGVKILGETIDRDGVGMGIGLAALLMLGVVTWAIVQMSKNLDPAKIAAKISIYIKETEETLRRIDRGGSERDRKLDLLMSIATKNEAMLREARDAGLEMSGQLHQIQRTVDTAIKTEIAKK
jgi:hypothetical protein